MKTTKLEEKNLGFCDAGEQICVPDPGGMGDSVNFTAWVCGFVGDSQTWLICWAIKLLERERNVSLWLIQAFFIEDILNDTWLNH